MTGTQGSRRYHGHGVARSVAVVVATCGIASDAAGRNGVSISAAGVAATASGATERPAVTGSVDGGSSRRALSLTCGRVGSCRPPGTLAGAGIGRAWNDMV